MPPTEFRARPGGVVQPAWHWAAPVGRCRLSATCGLAGAASTPSLGSAGWRAPRSPPCRGCAGAAQPGARYGRGRQCCGPTSMPSRCLWARARQPKCCARSERAGTPPPVRRCCAARREHARREPAQPPGSECAYGRISPAGQADFTRVRISPACRIRLGLRPKQLV